jgi:hypothetical protein
MNPPPPQPNPPHQPKRTRKILLISVVAILAILAIPCCGGLAYFGWRAWNTGADSSNAAISELFQGLKNRDQDRLENSLCQSDRPSAGKILAGFNASLESSGFELQTITWRRNSSNSTDHEITYTLTVVRDNERYKIQRIAKLEPVEERGWRVCHVSGLKI